MFTQLLSSYGRKVAQEVVLRVIDVVALADALATEVVTEVLCLEMALIVVSVHILHHLDIVLR